MLSDSKTYSHSSERRLHTRQRVLLSCLELEDDNGGIVLDISEHGLAMQTARSLGDGEYAQLRFQLSQSNDWVETRGRIAWISASKQTAGVEFVDLSSQHLISIRKWISSIESPNSSPGGRDRAVDVGSFSKTALANIVVEELVQELITEDLVALRPVETRDDPETSGNANGKGEYREPSENVRPTAGLEFVLEPRGARPAGPLTNNRGVTAKPRRHIGLLVGAALLLSVLILWAYFLRRAPRGRLDEKPAASEKLPEAPSNSLTSSETLPAKRVPPSGTGFILQIAAMKDEKSAILLADSLHAKGFPGYVFQPSANIYRVLVGPYGDTDSAVKAEGELRKQGFDVIRRRNTPSQ